MSIDSSGEIAERLDNEQLIEQQVTYCPKGQKSYKEDHAEDSTKCEAEQAPIYP